MRTNHPMAVLASVILLGVVFANMANGNALALRLRSRDPLSGNVKVTPTHHRALTPAKTTPSSGKDVADPGPGCGIFAGRLFLLSRSTVFSIIGTEPLTLTKWEGVD